MILVTETPQEQVKITVTPEGQGIAILANGSKILKLNVDGTLTRYMLNSGDRELGFETNNEGKIKEQSA